MIIFAVFVLIRRFWTTALMMWSDSCHACSRQLRPRAFSTRGGRGREAGRARRSRIKMVRALSSIFLLTTVYVRLYFRKGVWSNIARKWCFHNKKKLQIHVNKIRVLAFFWLCPALSSQLDQGVSQVCGQCVLGQVWPLISLWMYDCIKDCNYHYSLAAIVL